MDVPLPISTYVATLQIPETITHVKLDIGLGEYNINSVNWLKYEKNLLVFMIDPNGLNKDPATRAKHQIEHPDTMHPTNMYYELPIAIADIETPTHLTFYKMTKDAGTSSLYEPKDPRLGPVAERIITPAYSLKHFFDVFPWDRFPYIEYIKIDAQGADLDIIKSAGNYLRDRVVFITAEPEAQQYKGCTHNTQKNMSDYLTTQGFVQIKHPRTNDPTFVNSKFKEQAENIYLYQI